MKHQATRELFDYWNRLRGSRAAPERAEIEFAAIRNLIADMFMLKADAAHRFPFVLSGTRFNALACAEQKGCSFLQLWAPQEQRNIAAMLLTVMDASCPVLATAIAAGRLGQSRNRDVVSALGSAGSRARAHLGPHFAVGGTELVGAAPGKKHSLASLHPVGSESAARLFDVRTLFASAEAAGAALETESPAKKPYLKVLDGGRRIP